MFAGSLSVIQRLFSPAHHRRNKHTFFTTPVVATMVSAPSTVLFATVFTLATTASPTTLACSLVFSATAVSTKAEKSANQTLPEGCQIPWDDKMIALI